MGSNVKLRRRYASSISRFRYCVFSKSSVSELLIGNGNVDIGAEIRNDNPSVAARVHSIKSVSKVRRMIVVLESNREGLGITHRLSLSHIMGGLDISDGTSITTTRNKSIVLLSMNISQATSAPTRNFIRKSYPSDKQYLAPAGN